jgi:hypothetical protein
MSLNTRIAGRFRKVRNARARVPYGRATIVSGSLTTTDGVPVTNQPVAFTSLARQLGAASQPLGTATTDARGRFRFRVPAGPSRELTVTYPGTPGYLQRSRELWLITRANATIRASTSVISGMRRVRFSGRLGLIGAGLPAGGKQVELQARQGRRWTTIDTARADGPRAAWSGHVPFSGRPGRYRVRLRIPREAATFPYELGYSRSVVIRVR